MDADIKKIVEREKSGKGFDFGDIEVYSSGLFCCSVCSKLMAEETAQRLNQEFPSGVPGQWRLSEKKAFKGGEPMPFPCGKKEGFKHYLFEC